MKILLINYHYFQRGGPDTYFFNIADALEKEGHKVIPFSWNYEETLPTPYRHFFPEPITGPGPCMLAQQRLSPWAKLRAAAKMFWNPGAEYQLRELLRTERPDLVYSIYLSSTFLPKILSIAKREFGLPIVYRLSDFHMYCPSYLFFRNGAVCTECERSLWFAVHHQCMHGSLVASLIRVLQMKVIRWRQWYGAVDAFVCPSLFMYHRLAKNGIPASKLSHVPTFGCDLKSETNITNNVKESPSILYLGNVMQEKGVEILIKAYNRIHSPSLPLCLVGPVDQAYRERLLSLLDHQHLPLVTIEGPLKGAALDKEIRGARIVVHPALWYENMPNAVLEAMSAGKAVVATDIGSLPEIVVNGENGLLVRPGDDHALANAINSLMIDPVSCYEMGCAGRRRYEQIYKKDAHLGVLLPIFEKLLSERKVKGLLDQPY